MLIDLNLLMDYADWERQKWYDWLRQQDEQVLTISVGPHGDGRFQTVGDLMRHVFSAEKRYVERLSGIELAREYIRAIEGGATGDELARFFTPDVAITEIPNRVAPHGSVSDLAKALEAAKRSQRLFKRQTYAITNILGDGDRVALEMDWIGITAVQIRCLWRIDTVAVKRSDPRNPLRLRTQIPNDFIGSSCPTLTGYRSERESLKSQAPAGVWYRPRQWGCHRNERRFATGRDRGVSGVRPSSD
jgi:hypothetical protein